MLKLSKKLWSIAAGVVVAGSGLAALQLSRPGPGASAAEPATIPRSAGALDLTAPPLVKPVRPLTAGTQPAPRRFVVSSPSAPFPQEYRILLVRSVFSNQPVRRVGPGGGPDGPGGGPRSYEANLTFRGAMRDGSDIVAFIDDGTTSRTLRLKVGDKLGRGEIRGISLNQLQYQLGNRTVPVDIGMNLTGTGITATTRPSAGPSTDTQTASSSSASDASSSASAGADSIVERMRKRRQREEGGL